tara:strand:- start:583 stop:1251 length:669 start_codon:yes stop_codon:yes gene_type:complete
MKIKKKILKNIIIQNFLGFLVSIYIYIVKITSNFRYENQNIPEKYWNDGKPFILAFWHNQLMTVSFAWKINKKLNILASGHSDGRFGAIVGKYFSLNNIPIQKRNKNYSLRSLFKLIREEQYIGITPDGPRGPKEVVSDGVIKIAKTSEIPIIPLGFWSSNNFKLKSWDSFLITLPFSKCCFVWNKPLKIPNDSNEHQIKEYQEVLEKEINECIAQARFKCR